MEVKEKYQSVIDCINNVTQKLYDADNGIDHDESMEIADSLSSASSYLYDLMSSDPRT